MIAREDKGFLGIDYNRSPNIQFTIGRSNIHRPTTKAKKEPEDDVTKTTASASSDVTVNSRNSTSGDGIEEPTIGEIAERIEVRMACKASLKNFRPL